MKDKLLPRCSDLKIKIGLNGGSSSLSLYLSRLHLLLLHRMSVPHKRSWSDIDMHEISSIVDMECGLKDSSNDEL